MGTRNDWKCDGGRGSGRRRHGKQVECIFIDQFNTRDMCSYVSTAMHSHQLQQFN